MEASQIARPEGRVAPSPTLIEIIPVNISVSRRASPVPGQSGSADHAESVPGRYPDCY